MRYVLMAAVLLLAGCAGEGAAPYAGPPLVLSTYRFPTAPAAPVYRPGIMCTTHGNMMLCN